MSAERTKPDVFYTMTPSVVVIKLVEHPVSLLILHYILIRKKVYPKFRISDIAKQLKKDERTIRDNLKPLVELDLLALAGKIGAQYYEFNEDKYESHLRVNVFELAKNPFQELGGVPSQRTGGGGIPKNESSPLPKNGRVENTSKRKSKEESKEGTGDESISGSISFDDLEQAFQSQAPNPLMKEIKTEKLKPAKRSVTVDEWFGFNPDA